MTPILITWVIPYGAWLLLPAAYLLPKLYRGLRG